MENKKVRAGNAGVYAIGRIIGWTLVAAIIVGTLILVIGLLGSSDKSGAGFALFCSDSYNIVHFYFCVFFRHYVRLKKSFNSKSFVKLSAVI